MGEGLETGCALSSVPRQSYTRQNGWKWVKQMFKIKRPLGNSGNALPVQIVSAFVTDLLLRAFKHSSGFTSSLYYVCEQLSGIEPRDAQGAHQGSLTSSIGNYF